MGYLLAIIGIILMTLNLIGVTAFDWFIVISLICMPVIIPAGLFIVTFVVTFIVLMVKAVFNK